MGTRDPLRRARRLVAAPLKRYLDSRFDALEARLDSLSDTAAVEQGALRRIEVSEHNAGSAPPTFGRVVSQVVSAGQFGEPDFVRLEAILYPTTISVPAGGSATDGLHRKVWEYVYVLKAAEQHGVLEPGRRGCGFGVGTEPLPAALAKHGLSVVATDQGVEGEGADSWISTGQHMSGLRALSNPAIVADDELNRLVEPRTVDMNAIPDDLGTFDLVWSCCALEHLGSPEAGLRFVLESLRLLEPGGVCVHTTELELTRREQTAEYGSTVVYRRADLEGLVTEIRSRGFEVETNWYVSLETPADRFVSTPPHVMPHLKLLLGDSVSTSAGLIVRRPLHGVAG